MKSWILALVATAAVAGACAAPAPLYAEVASQLPSISEGHGRVFVLRGYTGHGLVIANIRLNNISVVRLSPGWVAYFDLPAGNHVLRASSDALEFGASDHEIAIQVEPGSRQYLEWVWASSLGEDGGPTLLPLEAGSAERDAGALRYGKARLSAPLDARPRD